MALLYFCTSNPVIFYSLYLLVGFTAAMPSTVVLSKLISGWFDKKRGMIFGITAGCGISLGYFILPKASLSLIQSLGWRGAYLGLGAIILVIGFPILLLFRGAPAQAGTAAKTKEPEAEGMTAAEARRTPQFWMLLVSITLGCGVFAALNTHIFAYASDRGLPVGMAVASQMAGAVANGLWQVVLGRFLDKTSTPRIAAPMILISLVGIAMVMFTSSGPLWIVAGFLRGVASGAEYGLVPYAVRRYFGSRAFGEIYGLIFGVVMLGMGLFPLLAATVFDKFGSYNLAFAAVAGLAAVSGVVVALLPPYIRAAKTPAPSSANAPAPDLTDAAQA